MVPCTRALARATADTIGLHTEFTRLHHVEQGGSKSPACSISSPAPGTGQSQSAWAGEHQMEEVSTQVKPGCASPETARGKGASQLLISGVAAAHTSLQPWQGAAPGLPTSGMSNHMVTLPGASWGCIGKVHSMGQVQPSVCQAAHICLGGCRWAAFPASPTSLQGQCACWAPPHSLSRLLVQTTTRKHSRSRGNSLGSAPRLLLSCKASAWGWFKPKWIKDSLAGQEEAAKPNSSSSQTSS